MWSFARRKPRAMRAKGSFIVFNKAGRPIGLVPEGSLWVKSHPVVRSNRDRFEREKAT
jgi:hypothetical protein